MTWPAHDPRFPALPPLETLAERRCQTYANMDPTATLLVEHEWLEESLLVLRASARHGADAVRRVFDIFSAVLDVHIRKEEHAYFPALTAAYAVAGRNPSIIDDMIGEHDGVNIRRDEVESALAGGRPLDRAAAAFAHALVVHFENEEGWVLEGAAALLGEGAAAVVETFRALDV